MQDQCRLQAIDSGSSSLLPVALFHFASLSLGTFTGATVEGGKSQRVLILLLDETRPRRPWCIRGGDKRGMCSRVRVGVGVGVGVGEGKTRTLTKPMSVLFSRKH